MDHTSAPQQIRRLVLVPATASGRGDELVRRYRLARLRLAGREAARGLTPAGGPGPSSGGGGQSLRTT
ncbi:MAG TPA: hypothetical protein VI006_06140 [Solirubrobacteraceae bacterium]